MNYDQGLTGRALIDATTDVVMKTVHNVTNHISIERVREVVVDCYQQVEYFDGEPADPSWFAKRIMDRIKWKELS